MIGVVLRRAQGRGTTILKWWTGCLYHGITMILRWRCSDDLARDNGRMRVRQFIAVQIAVPLMTRRKVCFWGFYTKTQRLSRMSIRKKKEESGGVLSHDSQLMNIE